MTCTRCSSTRLVWRSVIGARTETLCAGCREPWRRFVLGVLVTPESLEGYRVACVAGRRVA